MAHGMSREEAESGPHAHAITRWLGVDAPDPVPRTTARRLDGPGWLLVCSDGLWNYCSAAPALRELVTATVAGLARRPEGATQARPAGEAAESALDLPTGPPAQAWPDPEVVAEELVAWANRQGGHDNITVALARVG
jgi:serine/threonine protein phosphatase PrpC